MFAEGEGGLGNIHDEAKGDSLLALGGWILEGVVTKLAGEAEVEGGGGGV